MLVLTRKLNDLFPRKRSSSKRKSITPSKKMPPTYAPPPGPPPGYPNIVAFPFLHPQDLPAFFSQGYARIHFPPNHPLQIAAKNLFNTSKDFFAKPLEHKEQFALAKFPAENNGHNSEEGWSKVEGEKEMLTIRRAAIICPPEAIDPGRTLWHECGEVMQAIIQSIESSLGMDSGALDNVVKEECVLPAKERHETLLRMFRYERTSDSPRLVAAQHRDIGLLSIVIGSSPGLDVWNETTQQWIAIEDDAPEGELTFTILVGQTLTRLTNNRYKPGVHRVFVPPIKPSANSSEDASPDDQAQYRYSIVYALRPYREAILSTSSLTTPITGEFDYPLEGVSARKLFNAIANSHWSVNDNEEVREAQRARMQKMNEALARERQVQDPPIVI